LAVSFIRLLEITARRLSDGRYVVQRLSVCRLDNFVQSTGGIALSWPPPLIQRSSAHPSVLSQDSAPDGRGTAYACDRDSAREIVPPPGVTTLAKWGARWL